MRNIAKLTILALLSACSAQEHNPNGYEEPVAVSLALSVSSSTQSQSRAGADVIQNNSSNFRELQILRVIPFNKQGEIVSGDNPITTMTCTDETVIDGNNAKFYFCQGEAPIGTASFLVYGQAKPKENKALNGSLTTNISTTAKPSEIAFSPERINPSTAIHSDAQTIADYLTRIANTEGWSETTNQQLQAYYLNFVGKGSVSPTAIAGSSASVKAWVNKLRTLIENEGASNLRVAILSNINNTTNIDNRSFPADFPASIGLPDGSAALQWDDTNKKFVPVTSTTVAPNVNSMNCFVYPPELYYYGNSQICTSNTATDHNSFVSKDWGGESLPEMSTVLSHYPNDPGIVSTETRSVAIKKPIQYGVARLDATIRTAKSSLKDAKGADIPVGIEAFPLTGIIVSGQREVGFNFVPKDDAQQFFSYDSQMLDDASQSICLSATEQGPVHSLVLQSKDEESELVILEFRNDGTVDFEGIDGTVYPNSKFYLVGRIDKPAFEASKDYTRRVFTQDYTTTVKITVESLAHAYNVVPNLSYYEGLSGMQAVVVDVTPWTDTSSNHEVYNW